MGKRVALGAAAMRVLVRAPSLPVRLPRPFIDSVLALRRYVSGLRRRSLRIGRFEIPYLEGGAGEPVVLMHGFGDSKESFVDLARLMQDHRVVLPDLPGFGDASAPLDHHYGFDGYCDLVGAFVERLGLGPCHLVGNSLGGAVATMLALTRPELVRSLGLLCAAGLVMPKPSPLQLQLDAGENPWVVHSYTEHQAWMRFVLESPPPIPGPVLRQLADDFIARAPLHEKILDEMLGDDIDLTPQLASIDVPALVIWGDRDRVIDISAGHLYRDQIPAARMVILHGIGHCPQLEAPQRTATLLRDFIASS